MTLYVANKQTPARIHRQDPCPACCGVLLQCVPPVVILPVRGDCDYLTLASPSRRVPVRHLQTYIFRRTAIRATFPFHYAYATTTTATTGTTTTTATSAISTSPARATATTTAHTAGASAARAAAVYTAAGATTSAVSAAASYEQAGG